LPYDFVWGLVITAIWIYNISVHCNCLHFKNCVRIIQHHHHQSQGNFISKCVAIIFFSFIILVYYNDRHYHSSTKYRWFCSSTYNVKYQLSINNVLEIAGAEVNMLQYSAPFTWFSEKYKYYVNKLNEQSNTIYLKNKYSCFPQYGYALNFLLIMLMYMFLCLCGISCSHMLQLIAFLGVSGRFLFKKYGLF
jgi:hypothetical protein